MTLLQIILIISGFIIIIIGYDFFQKKKITGLQVFLLVGISLSIFIFTIFPGVLNKFGHIFGVQRGADILVYISILFLFHIIIILYNNILFNKKNISILIRKISILEYELKHNDKK